MRKIVLHHKVKINSNFPRLALFLTAEIIQRICDPETSFAFNTLQHGAFVYVASVCASAFCLNFLVLIRCKSFPCIKE
jgi:hypothetical protein